MVGGQLDGGAVMSNHGTTIRIFTLLACCLAAGGASALAQGVYSAGLFELGDGQAPPGFAGAADILGTADQSGPDWGNLFNAAGGLQAGARGAFVADDVSLGSGFEGTELAGSPDLVRNGRVAAADDIGNAYVYSTLDAAGHTVLYLGAERLSGADSSLEFELNQTVVRLGHGGFGQGKPWKILGTRAANDALVHLDFASGGVASVSFYRWSDGQWQLAASLVGEGCDVDETLCAVSNAAAIDGGPWKPGEIAPGRFVEVGVNLGALFNADPILNSVRIRTPDDIAFGYFEEGN
jgi:hypothetical protein